MSLGPQDLLEIGTKVRVHNMLGTVVKASLVPAHNGGYIALHTIKFTDKVEVWRGARKSKIVKLKKPITKSCNYAFIQVEEG